MAKMFPLNYYYNSDNFDLFDSIRHDIDTIFNRVMPKNYADNYYRPNVNIIDKDGYFVIEVEAPGMNKDDITINLKKDIISIEGEKTSNNATDENNYLIRERYYGKFKRSFKLGFNANEKDITAKFVDGVLTISIEKQKESDNSSQISIE